MRRTKQRTAILNLMQDCGSHPTAEWIYERLRNEMPNISLATVYRLLGMLAEEQAIRQLRSADGPSRFDSNAKPHQHAVCKACGQVVDVPELLLPDARKEIERWTGFSIADLQMDWFGLCPRCRKDQDPNPEPH